MLKAVWLTPNEDLYPEGIEEGNLELKAYALAFKKNDIWKGSKCVSLTSNHTAAIYDFTEQIKKAFSSKI